MKQYNTIRKYWRIIKKYELKIDNAYTRYDAVAYYELESDDEDQNNEIYKHNERIDELIYTLKGKLDYYEKEYTNYVNKIGYKFNDQTQDEQLFNLLNNGIMINK
jgi:hypothetical protein